MSAVETTMTEIAGSVTGFDEIAVEKHFGFDLFEATSASKATRALVFIQLRRDGLKDDEAYKAAMNKPTSTLDQFFAEEPEEVMPDEPDTDPGKESDSSHVEPPD